MKNNNKQNNKEDGENNFKIIERELELSHSFLRVEQFFNPKRIPFEFVFTNPFSTTCCYFTIKISSIYFKDLVSDSEELMFTKIKSENNQILVFQSTKEKKIHKNEPVNFKAYAILRSDSFYRGTFNKESAIKDQRHWMQLSIFDDIGEISCRIVREISE